ncbi:MAG: hypothetical protein AB7P23_09085 [Amphiplicatus sp.]
MSAATLLFMAIGALALLSILAVALVLRRRVMSRGERGLALASIAETQVQDLTRLLSLIERSGSRRADDPKEDAGQSAEKSWIEACGDADAALRNWFVVDQFILNPSSRRGLAADLEGLHDEIAEYRRIASLDGAARGPFAEEDRLALKCLENSIEKRLDASKGIIRETLEKLVA